MSLLLFHPFPGLFQFLNNPFRCYRLQNYRAAPLHEHAPMEPPYTLAVLVKSNLLIFGCLLSPFSFLLQGFNNLLRSDRLLFEPYTGGVVESGEDG